MSEYCIIFVTCGNKEEAEKIAESIVLEKLAACVNIVPTIQSIYFWEDKLCNEKEVLLIIKTKSILYNQLEKRIKDLHSYKVPEIILLTIEQGNPDYLKWIEKSTK